MASKLGGRIPRPPARQWLGASANLEDLTPRSSDTTFPSFYGRSVPPAAFCKTHPQAPCYLVGPSGRYNVPV